MCCRIRLEDGMVGCQGFQKWSNGGGLFHRFASIDPAAVLEIGAVIHPRATLGANVHVGSGGVVGPNVVVGQFTRLGSALQQIAVSQRTSWILEIMVVFLQSQSRNGVGK